MKKAIVLLLLATAASAQQHPHSEIFPSDYKPSPCASTEACVAFTEVNFEEAAHAFTLRTLDPKWVDRYVDELRATAKPFCAKRATCNGSPGRVWWFCNDVFSQELRATCDKRFDPKKEKYDNESCHTWTDTFSSGVDQFGSGPWNKAQECAKAAAANAPPARLHQMDWWAVPPVIPVNFNGPIVIYAIDRDTHVPVQADIRFEGQIIYTTDPTNGTPTTYYQFKWPRKLGRVPRADGHSDVVPPTMTITAPGYETIALPTPTALPTMIVAIAPPPAEWKPGVNKIQVNATDSLTGKPVEAQVYAATQTLGFTNKPLEVTIVKKGENPEIWVRSPFDAYSDVVAVTAKK
jgi:hypothetical protein